VKTAEACYRDSLAREVETELAQVESEEPRKVQLKGIGESEAWDLVGGPTQPGSGP
jgi:hypothetical protein